MEFKDALWELVLGDGRLPNEFRGSGVLAFTIASSLMGLIAVLLDLALFSVQRRSIFNLSYGQRYSKTFRLVCVWGLGAGLGGFLGAGASVFQLTRFACISVGVGWPLVLPRLIDSVTKERREEEQPTEEEQETQEKEN